MRGRRVPTGMTLRLIGLLLLVPLADALLLVVWASMLSWPLVVLLVVLTALVGMLLVRAEGRHTLRKIQRKLAVGDPPTDELVDGGLLIAAGAFLLTPGLVTDLLGFLLVVPLTRWPIRKLLKRYLGKRVDVRTGGFASGDVYTGGFPFGRVDVGVDGADAYTVDSDAFDVDGNVYDVDADAYDVNVDDDESDTSSA